MYIKACIPNSGAEDEHITAKKLGIKIHYVDPVENIEKIVNEVMLPVI